MGSNFALQRVCHDPKPAHTCIATATVNNSGTARFEGYAKWAIVQPQLLFETIPQLIDSWKDNWSLALSQFPENGATVAEAIRQGSAQGVCDVSYMPNVARHLGASAWIIEDPQRQDTPCSGVCQTPGEISDVNAYRAELHGVLNLLLALKAICSFHAIRERSVRLGCDNETAVFLADAEF